MTPNELIQTTIQHLSLIKLDSQFDLAVDIIVQNQGEVIFSGIGKSGKIADKISSSLRSLNIKSCFLHAAEACHGDLGQIHKNDCLVMLSHKGLSQECLKAWQRATDLKIKKILITSNQDNPMIESAQSYILYPNNELCLWKRMPSLSTMSMLLIGEILIHFIQKKINLKEEKYLSLHPAGSHGLDAIKITEIYIPKEKIAIVNENASLKSVIETINSYKLGTAIIEKNNKVIGIFTDGDLRRAILKNASLEDSISLHMTRKPKTISSSSTLGAVKALFANHRISSAPIVDENDNILGLIDHFFQGKF